MVAGDVPDSLRGKKLVSLDLAAMLAGAQYRGQFVGAVPPWGLPDFAQTTTSFKIREMGSRYFFIVAYVWLEKYFSRGDYRRADTRHGSSRAV